MDKDGDEVPIVEGEYSPNIERDIDLDVEGGVLPVEQKVNAPDGKEEAAPEIIVWFVSEWNSICAAHGCPGRTITKLTPADVTFFSAKPKVTLTLALFYLRRNKKFPKYPITFDTLRKDGKIEKYAELGAMDMAMDFSDKLDKGEPGTPAPVQAPQPGPGPAPRATAVAAAQDIPEELRSAWENILTFYPYDRIDLDQDTAAFLAGIETCTPEELAACARHHVDSKMEPRWVKGFPNFISTVLPILLRQLRAGTLKAPKVAVGGPAHRRESNIRAASQFLNAFAKPTQSKE